MQLFPIHIPDLSFGSPLIISGRYNGTFPELVRVTGTLSDRTSFEVDLKVKREKDMHLTNVISQYYGLIITCFSYLAENQKFILS